MHTQGFTAKLSHKNSKKYPEIADHQNRFCRFCCITHHTSCRHPHIFWACQLKHPSCCTQGTSIRAPCSKRDHGEFEFPLKLFPILSAHKLVTFCVFFRLYMKSPGQYLSFRQPSNRHSHPPKHNRLTLGKKAAQFAEGRTTDKILKLKFWWNLKELISIKEHCLHWSTLSNNLPFEPNLRSDFSNYDLITLMFQSRSTGGRWAELTCRSTKLSGYSSILHRWGSRISNVRQNYHWHCCDHIHLLWTLPLLMSVIPHRKLYYNRLHLVSSRFSHQNSASCLTYLTTSNCFISGPTTVLACSLMFIGLVVILHIYGKFSS